MLESQVRLAPPPRRVGLSLRIVTMLGHPALWLLFGFATIFFWTFVMNADFSFITFREPLRFVAGRVTKVETTNSSESKKPIMANHYEFSVDGRYLQGVSYSLRDGASVGERVVIQYKESDPSQSRIEGMRRHPFSPAVALLIVLPIVATVFLVRSVRKGMRRRHLLEHGVIAVGTRKDKRATNVRVNKQTVYELTFEFMSREGMKREAKVRTHQPERLEDERQEPLLYDPIDPTLVCMLDELPSRPKVDMMGELEGRPIAATLSLILAALVILGNLLALLSRLGK